MPQHLAAEELVGGNALVEMGTFIAILTGTIAGGVLSQFALGPLWIGAAVCLVAVAGWRVSLRIPAAAPAAPGLAINWNPLTQTLKTIRLARRERSVFLSILGISWFWFLGAAYLTQLPHFTREILRGSAGVVTLLLAMFSIGVGSGSLMCEKLSGRKVELGLVPLGSLGLSLFGLDLAWSHPIPAVEHLLGIREFLSGAGSVRLLIDLVMIGLFGGLFIVPLYALLQQRTAPEFRARVIAANNILNALFMVFSSLAAILLLSVLDWTIPRFFMGLAIVNLIVAVYIYSLVPEFMMRFLVWLLSHTMYRVRHRNLDRIPEEGPALLVCNHVSYVDALIIAGACRRPIRFVMDASIYRLPVLNFIFRTGKTIPIGSERKSPVLLKQSFRQISRALRSGELVCIFPEGRLTRDGRIDRFRRGVEKIIQRDPVPVVPLALRGLWGSFFSNKNGRALTRLPSRFWSRVEVLAHPPVAPRRATVDFLHTTVNTLRGPYP